MQFLNPVFVAGNCSENEKVSIQEGPLLLVQSNENRDDYFLLQRIAFLRKNWDWSRSDLDGAGPRIINWELFYKNASRLILMKVYYKNSFDAILCPGTGPVFFDSCQTKQ